MRTLLICLVLAVPVAAFADEKDELAAKQQANVAAVLKRCNLPDATAVGTADLIVAGPFDEPKLKAMAEPLQKHFALVLKALKFEMTDNPPKGKLAVYLFPERKQLSAFVGEVVGDKLERDERTHLNAKGNDPHIAVSVLPGDKPTDLEAEAANQISTVLLQAKAGTDSLPAWLQDGFARAIKLRSDPRLAPDRTRIRVLSSKFKVADAWTPSREKDRQLMNASLAEYLVLGQSADNARKFLTAFRVPEDDPKPSIDTVLMAIDMTPEKLEAAWKKWVLTGK